jgi:hypothetical protein
MQERNVIDSGLWVKEQVESKLVEGNFKSAIPLLEKLIRLGRNDVSLKEFAYARLGDSYISLRRFDKAEKYLKKDRRGKLQRVSLPLSLKPRVQRFRNDLRGYK